MPGITQEPSIILAACIFVLILCSFIVWFVVAYQKSTFKFLQEKQIMESAFKEELLQSQIEVQEATFTALGRELHDNIGQLLSTTKMLIGITERSIPSPPDTLITANETLSTAINELRSLSKTLSREWLAQFSLKENLLNEIGRLNSAKTIHFHLKLPNEIFLKNEEQIILFRIIQEAIQNAIKHSLAQNIYIEMEEKGDQLFTTVIDDGKGFNEAAVHKGLGIMHLKQRTRLLGGTIKWANNNRGCTVSILIPLKKEDL
jgi:signal transduction histidine kinase